MRGRRRYREHTNHKQERISSAATILGLSDQGVSVYERYGLVYPERGEENGYRSFDLMDIVMLQNARVMRESGFSLKEVQRLTHGCTVEEVARAYGDLLDTQRANLERLELKVAFLEEMADDVASIPERLYQCEKTVRPALLRFEYMGISGIELDDAQHAVIEQWAAYPPFTMISTRYPREPLEAGRLAPDAYGEGVRAGLGMHARYAEKLGVERSTCVDLLEPVAAVHCVTHASNDGLNPDFGPVLAYFRENRLRIEGDAISLGIVGLNFDKEFDRYCHLWVPYREE